MAPNFVRTLRERGLPAEPPAENPHDIARSQWESLLAGPPPPPLPTATTVSGPGRRRWKAQELRASRHPSNQPVEKNFYLRRTKADEEKLWPRMGKNWDDMTAADWADYRRCRDVNVCVRKFDGLRRP